MGTHTAHTLLGALGHSRDGDSAHGLDSGVLPARTAFLTSAAGKTMEAMALRRLD